jgi:hypothetical protein
MHDAPLTRVARRARRAMALVVLLSAVGTPAAACPLSLAQLLALPLEQLLELRVGVACTASAPAPGSAR